MTNQLKLIILFLLSISFSFNLYTQDSLRWKITDIDKITWLTKPHDSHIDHLEMSGLYTSGIVYYGVQNGKLSQKIHLVFPMLRTLPNDTHASLAHPINYDSIQSIVINLEGSLKSKDIKVIEYPQSFSFDGTLTYTCNTDVGMQIKHHLFPSTDQSAFIEKICVINKNSQKITFDIGNVDYQYFTDPTKGVNGSYTIAAKSTKTGLVTLKPNEKLEYAIIYTAKMAQEMDQYISPDHELRKRMSFLKSTETSLVFESPNQSINKAFQFSKIRAAESIFNTKGGLMHAPGGGRYYAAIWANDQAEYANPFFPYLGNDIANESAINSFRHFARFMNEDYKPIPSSIIAEGIDYWNGAGDRGDMAMIAYGAGRFALTYGDNQTAKELWPLISWCLEYCKRKINKHGVVASDSDELEGRFPAGKANLNTSCLYYDALISAVFLGKELGINSAELSNYSNQAIAIKTSIENYFGSQVEGFDTYRYYEGNDKLRAWICTPLTVDIFERSKGTIDALFSDQLWTDDGLASVTGSTTFWDRATLYALRGVLASGETKKAIHFLDYYSKRRLLGEHVPYPVEAYPEGNQRHLSAESALYGRVITEGLFGIRPTGFSSFNFTPQLPENWDFMRLKNIMAFGNTFNIEIKRIDDKLNIHIYSINQTHLQTILKSGETVNVKL
jgi:hypothetical protein